MSNPVSAAKLILSNGSQFAGGAFGFTRDVSGEVVFNTGMVGYPEALTDPSYRGQILVLTYPLVGNYGVPFGERKNGVLGGQFESDRIQVAGLVVQDYSQEFSHFAARASLQAWLKKWRVSAITGVDTRALTMMLREKGVMLGRIETGPLTRSDRSRSTLSLRERGRVRAFEDPNKRNLVAEVSCKKPIVYRGKARGPRILLYDCGVKLSIIRALLNRGCTVIRVPWDYNLAKSRLRFDGIVVSNGPGDPKMCKETVFAIRWAMDHSIPLLGICLGSQLMALAAGANTYKLKYGHRSQNQPCLEMGTKRCYITTQNHGYVVDGKTLPKEWQGWFTNANDRTNEGICHAHKPFLAVQFHPEANPGPTDTDWIFDRFLKRL